MSKIQKTIVSITINTTRINPGEKMGEWSDYFEDFPEENPANYVNDNFNPGLAKIISQKEQEKADAQAEINKLLLNDWLIRKEKNYTVTKECPQCGLDGLKIYYFNNKFYLCECQDCGIYGKGKNFDAAIKAIVDAFGDGLDWREISEPWKG